MRPSTVTPADNPGFLDTLTWDPAKAAVFAAMALQDGRLKPLARRLAASGGADLRPLASAARAASAPPLALFPASLTPVGSTGLLLLGALEDGQRLFLLLGPGRGSGRTPLARAEFHVEGQTVRAAAYPVDLPHLRWVLRDLAPAYAPVAPAGPGLGIGCRMGVLDLPVALQVVARYGLSASVIQSSVYRELAPLADLSRLPLPEIDLPGVGLVPLGHTGMSITGQFVAMLAERIALGDTTPIVADADHLPLRGTDPASRGLAARLVRESADRTLFTLDPHFCFYGADPSLAAALAERRTADLEAGFRRRFSPGARRDLLARYAGKTFRVPDGAGGRAGVPVRFSREELLDCALRFQAPLEAVEEACQAIRSAKGRTPFGVEVSIDEVPGLSEPCHFFYLGSELARRKIPLFSLAPGLGFSKLDVDVRDPHGHFATRVRTLAGIARHFGVVMGIHSGDGKSLRTRRILAQATGGNSWYKISPDRQRSFFQALAHCPSGSAGRATFQDVYRASLARVLRLALAGQGETAAVARQTLERVLAGDGLSGGLARQLGGLLRQAKRPSRSAQRAWVDRIASATPRLVPGGLADGIIHDYAFAYVGDRDAGGGFLNRPRLFRLPAEALANYQRLDRAYLTNLVRSLGLDR